jgi:peptide/nickel transport system substrate-binding protein
VASKAGAVSSEAEWQTFRRAPTLAIMLGLVGIRGTRAVLATTLALSVLAASCDSSSPKSKGSVTQPGGTLRVGVVIALEEQCGFVFCGAKTNDPQMNWSAMLFEIERCCLLRTLLSNNGRDTAEGGGALRPDLATSLPEVSADGLTWTFHLRRGIHYGPPLQSETVTAQDFIRSIERALSPRPGWLPEGFDPYLDSYLGRYLNLAGAIVGAEAYRGEPGQHISGLQAPDDHTLVVHLTRASGNLGYLLSLPETAPIPSVPSHPEWRFGAAQGHERVYSSYLVSSGPYMIEGSPKLDFTKSPQQQLPASGDAPDSLTLVRNPSWNPDADHLRAALPDRIQLVPVRDPKVAQRLIKQGSIDLAFNWDAPPSLLKSDSPTSPRDQVSFLTLNLAIRPLDDVHVRRAMNFAIERRPILPLWNNVNLFATPMTHIGLDDQESNLLLNFDPYHSATGDLKAARKEMSLSRYDHNHDGRCDDSACRGILLWANKEHPEQIASARMVARDLTRIGLDVSVHTLSPEEFFAPFGDPTVHAPMLLDQWLKDTLSPTTYFAPLFGGSSLQITGGQNVNLLGAKPGELKKWGYRVSHVPSVDSRISKCLTLTFNEQTRCYAEFDQFLTTQVVPWVPLVSLVSSRLTSDRVSAFNFDPSPSNPMPALDRVMLEPGSPPAPFSHKQHLVPSIPNGVYRFTITREDLLHFDPESDRGGILENTGTTTAYLRNGLFEFVQRADHEIENPISVGTYQGRGDQVTFHVQQPTFNALTIPKASWRLNGRALRIKLLNCGDLDQLDPSGHLCKDIRAVYEAHPWMKVADLP